jgi:hypothetical protein
MLFGSDFFGINMIGTYEERKVDNTEINGVVIDTALVTDSDQPYETGIRHPKYNNGKWVIVEMYNTKREARTGHNKWVEIFSKEELPELDRAL